MASTATKLVTILRSGNGIQYQLRATFPTDAAAPMGTSPITYGPEPGGVGQLRLVQVDGSSEWRIASNLLELTASSVTELPAMSIASGLTRTPGLAFKTRVAQNPNGPGPNEAISPVMGWSTANQAAGAATIEGLSFWFGSTFGAIERNPTTPTLNLFSYTANVLQTFTFVLRSTGFFIFIGDKLAYVSAVNNNTPLFPLVSQLSANRHTPRIASARVAQLGGPFATDNGYATTALTGARSVNDTFAHVANSHMIEFVATTLPSSGSITVDFRRADANNYWRLALDSAGALTLVEVVAGSPTTRATLNSNANGDRLMCYMDGSGAQIMRSRAGAGVSAAAYTSVSTGTTQTAGIVSSLGTGGAISNLITWPMTLTGEALAWIDAL